MSFSWVYLLDYSQTNLLLFGMYFELGDPLAKMPLFKRSLMALREPVGEDWYIFIQE